MADTTADAMNGLQSTLEPETQSHVPSDDAMDLAYPEPSPEQRADPQISIPSPVIDPALSALVVTTAPTQPTTNGETVKRKRGRPRTNFNTPSIFGLGLHGTLMAKRPVGRPRLDGLPAGSVPGRSPRKRGRPRKSAPSVLQDPTGSYSTSAGWSSAAYEPPRMPIVHTVQPVQVQAPVSHTDISYDSWAMMYKRQPNQFLRYLLSIVSSPEAGPPVTSVEETFKSHIADLASATAVAKQTHEKLSVYTSLRSFWLPTASPYFARTPTPHSLISEHRFFYWDPLALLFAGILCPTCGHSLNNAGPIPTGPVEVYDLGRPFWIIACEYQCSNCLVSKRDVWKFCSLDSSIMRALPASLQKEFPARVLHSNPGAINDVGTGPEVWNGQALGISKPLLRLVLGCAKASIDPYIMANLIQAIINGVPEESAESQEDEDEDAEHEVDEELAHVPGEEVNAGNSSTIQPAATQPSASSSTLPSQQPAIPSANWSSFPVQPPPPPQTYFFANWHAMIAARDAAYASAATTSRPNTVTFVTPIVNNLPERPSVGPSVISNDAPESEDTPTREPTREPTGAPTPANEEEEHVQPADAGPVAPSATTESAVAAPAPLPTSQAKEVSWRHYSPVPTPTPPPTQTPPTASTSTSTENSNSNSNPAPSSSHPGPTYFQTNFASLTYPPSSLLLGSPLRRAFIPVSQSPASTTASPSPANNSASTATISISTSEFVTRRPRHCFKCGSDECKGKGGRVFCLNACRDCGKLDCHGRNSRKPEKSCSEAWL